MGISRLQTKRQSRPRKSAAAKQKRLNTQKKRLATAGYGEALMKSMSAPQVRAALRRTARSGGTSPA